MAKSNASLIYKVVDQQDSRISLDSTTDLLVIWHSSIPESLDDTVQLELPLDFLPVMIT